MDSRIRLTNVRGDERIQDGMFIGAAGPRGLYFRPVGKLPGIALQLNALYDCSNEGPVVHEELPVE